MRESLKINNDNIALTFERSLSTLDKRIRRFFFTIIRRYLARWSTQSIWSSWLKISFEKLIHINCRFIHSNFPIRDSKHRFNGWTAFFWLNPTTESDIVHRVRVWLTIVRSFGQRTSTTRSTRVINCTEVEGICIDDECGEPPQHTRGVRFIANKSKKW